MEVGAGAMGADNLANSTKLLARLTCPFHSKKELAHIFFIVLPVHKWILGGQTPASTGATLSHWKPAGVRLLRPLPVGCLRQEASVCFCLEQQHEKSCCLTLARPSPFCMDIIPQMNTQVFISGTTFWSYSD